MAALKAKQEEAKKAEAKARLEAEKKVNEAKAKALAEKKAAEAAERLLLKHLQKKLPELLLKKLLQQKLLLNKKQSYPCKKGTKNIKSSSVMPVRIFYYYLCCNNLFIK